MSFGRKSTGSFHGQGGRKSTVDSRGFSVMCDDSEAAPHLLCAVMVTSRMRPAGASEESRARLLVSVSSSRNMHRQWLALLRPYWTAFFMDIDRRTTRRERDVLFGRGGLLDFGLKGYTALCTFPEGDRGVSNGGSRNWCVAPFRKKKKSPPKNPEVTALSQGRIGTSPKGVAYGHAPAPHGRL